MMIAEIFSGKCSFSEKEIDFLLLESRIENLLHVISHSESKDYRDLATDTVLRLYQGGLYLSLEDLTYVGDHADEPYVSRINKIIRDNI